MLSCYFWKVEPATRYIHVFHYFWSADETTSFILEEPKWHDEQASEEISAKTQREWWHLASGWTTQWLSCVCVWGCMFIQLKAHYSSETERKWDTVKAKLLYPPHPPTGWELQLIYNLSPKLENIFFLCHFWSSHSVMGYVRFWLLFTFPLQ